MRGILVMAWGLSPTMGCRIGFDARADADADADGPVSSFAIGGTVSGLAAEGLVLQLNGAEDLAVPTDGAFQFATAIADGSGYAVTTTAMPTGSTCLVANQEGVVAGGPVTNVEVTCFPIGACPAVPLTFVSNGTFNVPEGCTTVTVTALGGGGAGGGKNLGSVAAAGGNGGRAVATFTNLAAGTAFKLIIGRGGTCESMAATLGAYGGGGGGDDAGFGDGVDGSGASAPPGGIGGVGSVGPQPGGAGGNGGYGGGGGGGGGDKIFGNSGGGATAFQLVPRPSTTWSRAVAVARVRPIRMVMWPVQAARRAPDTPARTDRPSEAGRAPAAVVVVVRARAWAEPAKRRRLRTAARVESQRRAAHAHRRRTVPAAAS